MQDMTEASLALAATAWLAEFEQALAARDDAHLAALLRPDAHWRDLVAFTWQVETVSGARKIAAALLCHGADKAARGFALDRARTPPRIVSRAGENVIEAFFRFETARARAQGLVRLDLEAAHGDVHRAWTLFTSVDELKGFEENVGRRRPRGESFSRDFKGPNWLDRRNASAAYTDRDPAVLVVGGGQAGLCIGARLRQLDVDTLVVDRAGRVGDNWRNRYHALTLHNQVQVNHLPYMPFPPSWPTYIPKDKLAGWFEYYAESMEIDFWTGSEFGGGSYDASSGRWSVTLRRADGGTREMHPRHVVLATGVSGIPNRPEIPGLAAFAGMVLHSSQYEDGDEWKGRRALVIGTGNSGHDIAQDLYSSGAKVTLVQRNPTLVTNIEPSAQLAYALYDEGPPTEDCDLIAASLPLKLARKSHAMMTERGRQHDRVLLEGLERVGFKLCYEIGRAHV